MTIAEIAQQAETYAARYNPDRVVPFPWQNVVAQDDRLHVTYADSLDDNLSGAIFFQENAFFIVINSNKPDVRQHFTLAHELGHYELHRDILQQSEGFVDTESFLDGDRILYRDDNARWSTIEREANHFAATLLMPAELVRKAWGVTHDVERLAEIFKVSVVAMSIRLTELELVD